MSHEDDALFIAEMTPRIEPEMNDILAQQEANADYRTQMQEERMGIWEQQY